MSAWDLINGHRTDIQIWDLPEIGQDKGESTHVLRSYFRVGLSTTMSLMPHVTWVSGHFFLRVKLNMQYAKKGTWELNLGGKKSRETFSDITVPNLRRNLISTGQLGSEGYIVTLSDKLWKVTKGALVVAKGEKVGTLYLCTGNTYSTLATIETTAIGTTT